jgi:hypothetical protein
MTPHQIFANIPPALATEILEFAFTTDKALYHTALDAVAQMRRMRRVFLERQPRGERHALMVPCLGRAALGPPADALLRHWLLKKHVALVRDFLDGLGIKHEEGVVDDLPASVEDAPLQAAIEGLLAKHPAELVAIYLHAFHHMNEAQWANLDLHLQTDPRLGLKPGG